MGRPRKAERQLPAYCYRDRNGAYYMRLPGRPRVTYGRDLHRMLADWADLSEERPGETIGATMDLYLGELSRRRAKGEIAESTERDYQKHLGALRPVWGSVRWHDFDAPGVCRWQDARGAQSVVQCNRELTVLQQLAKLAGRKGLITDNPLRFIDRLREKPRDRLVTDAELAAVLKHATPPVRAAIFIASITGLRQGDILKLRRADFGPDGLAVRTRKTGKPMLFRWSDGLRQAYEMGVTSRTFASLHWLVTAKGEPFTGDGFRTMWDRALRAAVEHEGIARFTFHDLRAKAGSESRDWKLLGHMDQRTFERVYNRLPRQVEPTR